MEFWFCLSVGDQSRYSASFLGIWMQLLTLIPQLRRGETVELAAKTGIKACDNSQSSVLNCWSRITHRSIRSDNLQITLIRNAFSKWTIRPASQNNTSATGAYFCHLILYCKHSNLSTHIPARGKMSVHPRWHRNQKRIELPQESKLPSSTQHHLVKKITSKNTWHQQKYNE